MLNFQNILFGLVFVLLDCFRDCSCSSLSFLFGFLGLIWWRFRFSGIFWLFLALRRLLLLSIRLFTIFSCFLWLGLNLFSFFFFFSLFSTLNLLLSLLLTFFFTFLNLLLSLNSLFLFLILLFLLLNSQILNNSLINGISRSDIQLYTNKSILQLWYSNSIRCIS